MGGCNATLKNRTKIFHISQNPKKAFLRQRLKVTQKLLPTGSRGVVQEGVRGVHLLKVAEPPA